MASEMVKKVSGSIMEGGSAKKGEVCIGGKCKMLGAASLLDMFERKVDVETTVVVACQATESNTREQLNVISIQDEEELVAKPRPETVVSKERRLQIEELDEWWTQKSRTPDKPKPSQDELNTLLNQLKVGDKVLLDATNPRITTSEPNEEIPLMVLSIFPYGTVELIAGMRSVNSSHHLDHAEESRETWPWAELPKQHGHETRPCLETIVETENVTRACNTLVPSTCGQHYQNEHGRGPMYTGRAPTCPSNTGTMSSLRGKKTTIPASKKRKRAVSSSGPTTEIRHPFLQDLVPASATYDPSRSKALALPPSLRYLYAILAHTLTGRRESTSVVTTHDAYFLWSMANEHIIDFAYFIAFAIRHQMERHKRGYFRLLNIAAQSSSLTLIIQMSPQGILSMLSMRMIEKRHGTYPPRYRIAQSTEEEDPEDILDDVPPHHKDPPTQPSPPSRPVRTTASYADIFERLTRFEQ
ncbi:hypothetical protein GOBAR_AA24261 [Gossypium barbadense]|uniref:Uncharacterized protein n=1 Tax=Gossypium barbadense TaxID=3634 RepID=A0A2P5WZ91_GOSBA|nr:hypothetical protein GOBAR_AA24261 [Gossypium barbadense]